MPPSAFFYVFRKSTGETIEVLKEDGQEKLMLPCGKSTTRRNVLDHISGRTRGLGASGGCRICQGKVVKPDSDREATILRAIDAQTAELSAMIQRVQDGVEALNKRMGAMERRIESMSELLLLYS